MQFLLILNNHMVLIPRDLTQRWTSVHCRTGRLAWISTSGQHFHLVDNRTPWCKYDVLVPSLKNQSVHCIAILFLHWLKISEFAQKSSVKPHYFRTFQMQNDLLILPYNSLPIEHNNWKYPTHIPPVFYHKHRRTPKAAHMHWRCHLDSWRKDDDLNAKLTYQNLKKTEPSILILLLYSPYQV